MGSGILSPWHIAILVMALLLIYGPKRLPELGRSLGQGLREFKGTLSGPSDSGSDEEVEPGAASLAASAKALSVREHDTL
jgi:sec-independent protein translocase protein TatA